MKVYDTDGKLQVKTDETKNKSTWLSTTTRLVTQANITSSVSWTDVDVTAYTTSTTKFVYLLLVIRTDSISGGIAYLRVRKNGDTPSATPYVVSPTQTGATGTKTETLTLAVDEDEIFEYEVDITATIQVDVYIDLLGYIE